MAEINIQTVRKTFVGSKQPAVNDVDLTVADTEFMVLLGPSGCGKTTLLRMIAGLEYPDSGSILIGGRDVTDLPPRNRDIAMVFQSYAVFPHMKVSDNIAFGLKMHHMAKAEITKKVARAAELLQLTPYLSRFSAQLSGGQRQRVAVARAIVMEPSVLLMDEPLSNLDALLRLNFRSELKKLVHEIKTTTIYVTHDQVEALSLGDRIAVMRDGVIVQCGTPMEVYSNPATEFVGGFIGNPPMNFLQGRLMRENGRLQVAVGEHLLAAPLALTGATDGTVRVGIRAEDIRATLEASPDAIPARAEVVEPVGANLLVTAVVGDQRIKVLTRTDFAVQTGGDLWLQPEWDKLRWFDPQTQKEIAAE
ncbi:MAG: ABC transporter ATP-binding protein [Thermomicrobia bacterium]|nr:ABC transporter ATP-binding protein [Thermomicrobia bacterium]